MWDILKGYLYLALINFTAIPSFQYAIVLMLTHRLPFAHQLNPLRKKEVYDKQGFAFLREVGRGETANPDKY